MIPKLSANYTNLITPHDDVERTCCANATNGCLAVYQFQRPQQVVTKDLSKDQKTDGLDDAKDRG